MNRKILSIVIISRNDDYMEDQLYRLSTVLCFMADNLVELDQLERVEAIIVDWGSEVPLRESLALSEAARCLTRFVTVSPQCVSEVSPGTHFHSTLAVNVGLRRASGEYRMLADSDSLMPLHCLRSLLGLLSGKTLIEVPIKKTYLHIPRFQVRWEIGRRRPSLSQWQRYCTVLGASLEPESPSAASGCLGGFAACQLLHKDLWDELTGYDEGLRQIWGWCDNDLMLRLSQKYGSVNTLIYGVYSMHMEHLPRKPKTNGFATKASNPMRIRYEFTANGKNWGLPERSDLRPESLAKYEVLRRNVSMEADFCPINGAYQKVEEIRSFHDYVLVSQLSTVVGNPEIRVREFESILVLAGISKSVLPLSFAWFGSINLILLAAFLAFSRGVECWFCNIWEEQDLGPNSPNNPGEMSGYLSHSSYKGNARILLGDLTESFDVIAKEALGSGRLEVAFIAAGCPDCNELAYLLNVFDQLVHGGCVVIEAPSEEAENDDQEALLFSQWFAKCRVLEVHPFELRRSPQQVAIDSLLRRRPAARAYNIGLSGQVLLVST